MSADQAALEALSGIADVPRETLDRLRLYVDLLLSWQQRLNLIGRRTEQEVWTRHIADSLQLIRHAPAAGNWIDLGAGAGLPGLVVAICSARPLVLVESDGRKCAFLREAARVTGAPVEILHMRIEALTGRGRPGRSRRARDAGTGGEPLAGVLSARALAPLPELFRLAAPLFGPDTVGLFHKGARWRDELTAAGESWIFDATPLGSLTHPDSVVLRVTSLAPRHDAGADMGLRPGRRPDAGGRGPDRPSRRPAGPKRSKE